jgi:hypothetical protein
MVKIALQIACAHPPAAKVSSSGDSVSLIVGWNSPFSSRMCEGFFEENSLLIFHQFFQASTQGFMSRAGKGPGRRHSGQTKRPLTKGEFKTQWVFRDSFCPVFEFQISSLALISTQVSALQFQVLLCRQGCLCH